jgi:peptide/nickel transport system ATP-binding protein
MSALEVRDLTVGYLADGAAPTVVVRGVDLVLEPGRILGLAGESGCGKSTAALSAIGFPVAGSVRFRGSAMLDGVDLLSLPLAGLRRVWGRKIAYVSQDAAQALNPLHRIGRLLGDALGLHLGLEGRAASARAAELLDKVGIPEPEVALRRFPHQFSGGQQQRIALAIAMSCEPSVLVLDEPTTGLDVTTQAQISSLILDLVRTSGAAALSISHDLALLATVCDDVAIMYAGEIVERASAATLFDSSRHPYAAALVDAAPRIDEATPMVGIPGLPPPEVVDDACAFAPRCRFAVDRCRDEKPALAIVAPGHEVRCLRTAELGVIGSARTRSTEKRSVDRDVPILTIEDVRCSYRGERRTIAVDGVSLAVSAGETLAVVGESGSGKSTLLRAIAGLHAPDEGRIALHGRELKARAVNRPRDVLRAVQIVFQNPDSSLNPRHTIAAILDRPLVLFRTDLDRAGRRDRIAELLADVRLDAGLLRRYPAQLSGGQKQRVALARAFAAEPEVILCDEVVSALDVSVQASILELLASLARESGVALLFVTHDLAVVRSIADRVCVMRDGSVRESAPTERIFGAPEDPYTRELLAAAPRRHGARASETS